jgi:hypothetical protein
MAITAAGAGFAPVNLFASTHVQWDMNEAVLGATFFAMDPGDLGLATALVARAQAREVKAFEAL